MTCTVLAAAGCVQRPADPWVAGGRALQRGNLLAALAWFDSVPPAHPEYADARTAAKAIERRMRTAQRLLLQGFELRAQWRDDEALVVLRRSAEIWPGREDAGALRAATEARSESQQVRRDPPPVADLAVLETRTIVEDGDGGRTPRPDGRSADERAHDGGDRSPPPGAHGDGPGAAPPGGAAVVQRPERVGRGAGSPGAVRNETGATVDSVIRDLVSRGDLDAAIEMVREEVEGARLDDRERGAWSRRLGALLRSRALRRYGLGQLELALVDWHELAGIQPLDRTTEGFVRAAEAELAARDG